MGPSENGKWTRFGCQAAAARHTPALEAPLLETSTRSWYSGPPAEPTKASYSIPSTPQSLLKAAQGLAPGLSPLLL